MVCSARCVCTRITQKRPLATGSYGSKAAHPTDGGFNYEVLHGGTENANCVAGALPIGQTVV